MFYICSYICMERIADDVLLTHLEVALAVAPELTLAALNANDPRAQRSARFVEWTEIF